MTIVTRSAGPVLALWLGAIWGSAAQAAPYPPFDQAAQNPGFVAFRATLMDIAAARDLPALAQIMHPDIVTSFGGSGGVAEARARFVDDPQLWAELSEVLRLGGRFEEEGRRFVAPYTFHFEADDPFDVVIVTGQNVNVRASPTLDAPVLAQLSHESVSLSGNDPFGTEGWVAVETEAGLRGYVSADFARSPVDYRAGFAWDGARWLMEYFVAGD